MPVITISRMFGSGGSVVAEGVARALRWTLLDNAFVDRVASGLHTTPAHVQAIEERPPSIAERIADAFAYGAQEMLTAPLPDSLPPTEERLMEVTRKVIDEAVSRGPVVLVGRGAQARLEYRDDALHVFCAAPHDALIARIAERESLPRDEAARRVDDVNRQRTQFIKRHFKRDWANPAHYHLCVNTAWLGIDASVGLILDVARARGLSAV